MADRTYQNQNQENWSNPFDHNSEKLFAFEVTVTSFTSSAIAFGLIINPTKIQVKNVTIGTSILLLKKSIISRIVIPIQLMKLRGPNPREDGIPITSARAVNQQTSAFAPVEFVTEDGYDSFHQADRRSKCCEEYHQEEQASVKSAEFHAVKYFCRCHDISPGPELNMERSPPENTNTAGMIIQSCQKGDTGIEYFNLSDRTFQVVLFFI